VRWHVGLGLAVTLAFQAPRIAAAAATASDAAAATETSPAPRPTVREALLTFAADGRYLFTFPARTSAKGVWLTAGVAAATALTMNRDEEIRDEVLEADGRTTRRVSTRFEPLGRHQVEMAALGTFYLVARGARNERAVSTAATAFESYLWAAITTSATKAAFGRERPGGGSGEGRFFAGDSIFPSGHTARSFAIAAVLAERHGRRAAWIAYPLATLVGLSTIEQDLHWTSDVVAGAGLGLAIGKGIAARHPAAPRNPARAAWQVMPARGGAVLQIVY
jgi:membrane-associated phospholipid phosphatase